MLPMATPEGPIDATAAVVCAVRIRGKTAEPIVTSATCSCLRFRLETIRVQEDVRLTIITMSPDMFIEPIWITVDVHVINATGNAIRDIPKGQVHYKWGPGAYEIPEGARIYRMPGLGTGLEARTDLVGSTGKATIRCTMRVCGITANAQALLRALGRIKGVPEDSLDNPLSMAMALCERLGETNAIICIRDQQKAERHIAERLEAGRLEAERREAERLETERIEVARREAERRETERIETERREADRREAARREAARRTAERRTADRRTAERHEASPAASASPATQASPATEAAQDGQSMCAICRERPIDTMLQCGHAACAACVGALEPRRCHICRVPIEHTQRIYL